jgi:DNA-binding MarR family transcriptional regulator
VASEQDAIHKSIAHLQRLSDLLGERRRQLAARVGLSEQQWRVLEEISTEHFIPSLFAKSRDSSAAAVSKVLRQLLDKTLVRVSVSDSDGRQRNYELTAKGRQTMERLRAHRQRAIDAIWSELPREELARFNRFSDDLITRIERFAALEAAESTGSRRDAASPQALAPQRGNSATRATRGVISP